jgi:hypothetical protein
MSWHVEQEVLRRYQQGTADRVTAASLEAHVTGCELCRGLLAVDDEWLEQSWTAVANRVEPSRPSLVERSLETVGIPENVARLVAVSPALRISFVLAVALVTVFAAVASTSSPDGETFRIFLVVAPLLPVAGVAFAYGRLVDPAHELTMVAPIDSFRLLMLRATTVLTVSIGLGLIAWPVVPAPGSFGPSAWLLPALALTLTTLALASRFEIWLAGVLVGSGWVAAMLLAYTQELETFDARAQIVYAGLIGLAAVVVAIRRDSYDREGGHR